MRNSGPRLWPRYEYVEKQATDRHADRERVRQLGSPPCQVQVRNNVIDRMRHDRGADIGPVDKIWRDPVVHGNFAKWT